MPEQPSSNVKIYDRPERKGPSPLMIIIGLLVLLAVGFFLYKAFYHPATGAKAPPAFLHISSVKTAGREHSPCA